MKFVVDGNQINCLRMVTDSRTREQKEIVVVSFDAHLDTIAPHVESVLSDEELNQLKSWLKDRSKLDKRSKEYTVLKVLPLLLDESVCVLKNIDEIDSVTYNSIRGSLYSLENVLSNIEITLTNGNEDRLEEISQNEALKKQLGKIKEEL